MRRKLLSIAILMIAGIVSMEWIDRRILWALPAAAFILFITLCKISKQKKFLLCLLLSFCTGCVLMLSAQHAEEQGHLQECMGKNVTLTATVVEVQRSDEEKYKLRCDVGVELLLCSYYRPLVNHWDLTGCEITFTAAVEKPKPSGNPRTFDYGLYLKTKKIFYTAVMNRYQVTSHSPSLTYRVKRFILSHREEMIERLQIDAEVKGLIKGILFGDTASLDEDIYKEFQHNGTAHVLAVSGLHVGILYGLYKKCNGRRKSLLTALIFCLLLALYGTATLWSVSVTRAIFLVALTLLGNLWDRRYDTASALAAAALFIITDNPYAVMGASFQMSFLAVLSLTFFTPLLEKKLGSTLAVMVSVQLGLMPYMIYNFNYISFIGILCNIPVIFMISLLVPIGIAGYLWFIVTGRLFPLLADCLSGLGTLAIKVNHFFEAEGAFSFDIVSPPLWTICLLYGLVFLITSEHFRIYFKRKDFNELAPQTVFMITMVIFSFFASFTPFDQASIIFVDVGQGDCIHLKCDDGKNLLFDGGGNINYNIGEKTLKPYLLKNGIGQVQLAAATHLHTDHYLGLTQLAECFDVKKVLTKGRAGQRIMLGDAQWIDILWPQQQDPNIDDENLNSLIFKIQDHGVSVLITGDITEEGEKALVEKYKGTDTLKSDILKVAHHGSPYSTSDLFLDAVKPSVAVISVGKNNYGHPSNVVIEKLRKKGIMVFRTDQSGAVGIINRKGKISVCTKNQ